LNKKIENMSKILQLLKDIPESRQRDLADLFGVLLSKPESYWRTSHGQRRLARLFLARGDRSLFESQIEEFLAAQHPVVASDSLLAKAAHELREFCKTSSDKLSAAWKTVAETLEGAFKIEIDALAGAGIREMRTSDGAPPASAGQQDKRKTEDAKIWEWPPKGQGSDFGLRVVALGHPQDRELVLQATLGQENVPGLVFCVRHGQQRMSAKFDPISREAHIRIPRPGWRGWGRLQFSIEVESLNKE